NRIGGNAKRMTEKKNQGDTLNVAPAKTLTLKRPVESGIVRQSFSHGRSKAGVVEKGKRRAIAPGEAHAPREPAPPPAAAAPPAAPASRGRPGPAAGNAGAACAFGCNFTHVDGGGARGSVAGALGCP